MRVRHDCLLMDRNGDSKDEKARPAARTLSTPFSLLLLDTRRCERNGCWDFLFHPLVTFFKKPNDDTNYLRKGSKKAAAITAQFPVRLPLAKIKFGFPPSWQSFRVTVAAISHGPAQELSRAKSKHSVKIKIRLKGKMKHLIIGCIPCHVIFYIEETTDMESFHVRADYTHWSFPFSSHLELLWFHHSCLYLVWT